MNTNWRYLASVLPLVGGILGCTNGTAAPDTPDQAALRLLAVMIFEGRQLFGDLPHDVSKAQLDVLDRPEDMPCATQIIEARAALGLARARAGSSESISDSMVAESNAKLVLSEARLKESRKEPAYEAAHESAIVQMALARAKRENVGPPEGREAVAAAVARLDLADAACITPARRKMYVQLDIIKNNELARILSAQPQLINSLKSKLALPELLQRSKEMERLVQAARSKDARAAEFAKLHQPATPEEAKALDASQKALDAAVRTAAQNK